MDPGLRRDDDKGKLRMKGRNTEGFVMSIARIAAILLLAFFTSLPALAEGQRVILVLDASGSMWGQVDGRAKIDIAKEIVGKVVGTWKADDELGLVAYGHRKKGACDDIETLIEPGPLDAGTFMQSVNSLSPKGKTPMTQSVRQAAEALKFTEKQATVILVSDGIETCDPDPCAVAEELEKMGIGLTVHTVGFGLDDQGAVAQLQCLAEKTGGISVLAENADELETALKKTVEAKPAEPQPEPAATFNFEGRVVMAAGVDQLPQGFDTPSWEVSRAINGEKGDWVKTEYGAAIKSNIEAPGDYFAQVSLDLAKVQAPLSIMDGKTAKLDLSFEAGLITFKGELDDGQPLTDGSTTWELLDSGGNWLATKYGPGAGFFANAGNYKVRLSLGEAKVEQDIAFFAGKAEEKTITLGGGAIEVSAVFAPGGPPVLDGAAIELQKGEANVDGKHEWIATSYGSKTTYKLSPGKYRIVATQDYATGFADVEVKAGQVSAVEVSVNGGFLAVRSEADATIEVYSGEVDISGNRKWIATDYNGQFNKAVNAGTVHVIAKKPDGTVIGEKDAAITAGQRSEVSIP
jgi:Ca-activated chloride channel family protein